MNCNDGDCTGMDGRMVLGFLARQALLYAHSDAVSRADAMDVCTAMQAQLQAEAEAFRPGWWQQLNVTQEACSSLVVPDLQAAYDARGALGVWAGVYLEAVSPTLIQYRLRFPNDAGDFPDAQTKLPEQWVKVPEPSNEYAQKGFLALQVRTLTPYECT